MTDLNKLSQDELVRIIDEVLELEKREKEAIGYLGGMIGTPDRMRTAAPILARALKDTILQGKQWAQIAQSGDNRVLVAMLKQYHEQEQFWARLEAEVAQLRSQNRTLTEENSNLARELRDALTKLNILENPYAKLARRETSQREQELLAENARLVSDNERLREALSLIEKRGCYHCSSDAHTALEGK